MRTHYKTLLENAWLGQWDLQTPEGGWRRVVVVIERAERFVPERRERKKKADGTYGEAPNKKLVVRFRNARKPMLMGPTNQKIVADLYGPYLEDWAGKAIALYVDPEVSFGGKKTGGIRVENKVPRAGASPMVETRPVDTAVAQRIADAVEGSREPGED